MGGPLASDSMQWLIDRSITIQPTPEHLAHFERALGPLDSLGERVLETLGSAWPALLVATVYAPPGRLLREWVIAQLHNRTDVRWAGRLLDHFRSHPPANAEQYLGIAFAESARGEDPTSLRRREILLKMMGEASLTAPEMLMRAWVILIGISQGRVHEAPSFEGDFGQTMAQHPEHGYLLRLRLRAQVGVELARLRRRGIGTGLSFGGFSEYSALSGWLARLEAGEFNALVPTLLADFRPEPLPGQFERPEWWRASIGGREILVWACWFKNDHLDPGELQAVQAGLAEASRRGPDDAGRLLIHNRTGQDDRLRRLARSAQGVDVWSREALLDSLFERALGTLQAHLMAGGSGHTEPEDLVNERVPLSEMWSPETLAGSVQKLWRVRPWVARLSRAEKRWDRESQVARLAGVSGFLDQPAGLGGGVSGSR